MTPKEKGVWMLSIYNAQYDDYMFKAGMEKNTDGKWVKVREPDLTEAEREVMREKKKIMVEVYPLIKSYITYADSGIIPAADLETKIMQNIDKLLQLL